MPAPCLHQIRPQVVTQIQHLVGLPTRRALQGIGGALHVDLAALQLDHWRRRRTATHRVVLAKRLSGLVEIRFLRGTNHHIEEVPPLSGFSLEAEGVVHCAVRVRKRAVCAQKRLLARFLHVGEHVAQVGRILNVPLGIREHLALHGSIDVHVGDSFLHIVHDGRGHKRLTCALGPTQKQLHRVSDETALRHGEQIVQRTHHIEIAVGYVSVAVQGKHLLGSDYLLADVGAVAGESLQVRELAQCAKASIHRESTNSKVWIELKVTQILRIAVNID